MESTAASYRERMVDGYILKERLGSGSFATVYKGVLSEKRAATLSPDRKRTKTVAIKAINRCSEKVSKKLLDNLDIEISMMSSFRHKNIVSMMEEAVKTDKYIYLILEYCSGGDVQKLIRSRKRGRLSEGLSRRLVRDLSAGLKFLWSREVIHRDIKPQNLLLTGLLPLDEMNDPCKTETDEELRKNANTDTFSFHLKIADFGFARHLATASLADTLCGSPLYMAPEILQHHRYDAKADLWSVGTVLFEMLAGSPPFSGQNHLDLLRNIQRRAVRLPRGVHVSPQCVNLLRLLLNRNPLSRAGFQQFFDAVDEFVALGCNPPLRSSSPPSIRPSAPTASKPDNTLSLIKQTTKPPSSQFNPLDENDFVMVEHSNNMISAMTRKILCPSHKGLLSTSPNTGGALVAAMTHNPSSSYVASDFSNMLATAQDIARRAIHIVHVADARSALAMRLIHSHNDTANMILSDDDEKGHPISIAITGPSLEQVQEEDEEDQEDDDMPFAFTTSETSVTARNEPTSSSSQLSKSISIFTHFREALSCYLKALSLLQSALKASQLILEQLQSPNAFHHKCSPSNNNKILLRSTEITFNWLSNQFDFVLERADAANSEIQKHQPPSSPTDSYPSTTNTTQLSAEECIYNHALASGHDGAVKQLLGQYNAAKMCYRNAGILTESLLMDFSSSLNKKDRTILQDYVEEFKQRIQEIESGSSLSKSAMDDDDVQSKNTKSKETGVVGLVQRNNSVFSQQQRKQRVQLKKSSPNINNYTGSSNVDNNLPSLLESLIPPIPFSQNFKQFAFN